MSWKLALEYIRVLIWPVTTLTLGLIFRQQVSGLIARLQSVETPLASATFENQANAIAQEAAEVEGEIVSELDGEGVGHVAPLTQNEQYQIDEDREPTHSAEMRMSEQTFLQLSRLANSDPTSAIQGAWREVERALRLSLTSDVRVGISESSQALQRVTALGLLSSDIARIANDLLQLRNRALHEGEAILTQEGARSYVTAARRVIDALDLSRSSEVRAYQYADDLYRALVRNSESVERHAVTRGQTVDFLLENAAGQHVAVEWKFRTRNPLRGRDVEEVIRSVRRRVGDIGIILVTNLPLSAEARQFNAQPRDGEPPAEVIHWSDPSHDDLLVRALARAARSN